MKVKVKGFINSAAQNGLVRSRYNHDSMETELNVAASFKDVDVQPEPVELPQEIGKEMDRLQHNGLSFAEYIYAMRELELTDKSSERLLMQAWLFGWVAKPAEEGKDD